MNSQECGLQVSHSSFSISDPRVLCHGAVGSSDSTYGSPVPVALWCGWYWFMWGSLNLSEYLVLGTVGRHMSWNPCYPYGRF